MGVFADWAERYHDLGLNTIPCGGGKEKKGPLLDNWSAWCTEQMSPELVRQLVSRFSDCERIGLPLGPANCVVAFDFDYAYDPKIADIPESAFLKDAKVIERQIVSMLPVTPVKKVGAKGFTAFYKYHPTNKTVRIDRHNVRLFDFLSTGTQTILPPSHHSVINNKLLTYRWTDQDLLHSLNDLPYIDTDLVLELAYLFGSKSSRGLSGGRHRVLFDYVRSMSRVIKDQNKLEELLILKDQELGKTDPKGPYLTDTAHHKTGAAKDNAKKWVTRILKYNEKKIETKNIPLGADGWQHFFKECFFDLRKDVLSKKVFVKRDAASPWTAFEALDGVLRSYAAEQGLPKASVKDEMARFAFDKMDTEFLCDIPDWDGVDYVSQCCKSLKSSYFSSEEISEILKEWGVNMFLRVESSHNQNRCIIFQGPQNIGKDSFIKNLLSGFDPYYECIVPPTNNKDWLEVVARLFIVHIEEFDQTAGVDVPFLKSLITQPSSFFRESYGRDPNKKITAPSFISTANPNDFLRDPTGNRRFVVIPLDGISFDYPIKSLQVLAQFKALYQRGKYRLDGHIETKIKDLLNKLTPDSNDEWIVDLWKERAAKHWGSKGLHNNPDTEMKSLITLTQSDAAEVFSWIAKNIGCTPQKVRRVLKIKFQLRSAKERTWGVIERYDAK
jgi:hypothetical protein